MSNGQVKVTPLGMILSVLMIVGLIGLGVYMVAGKSGLSGLLGKRESSTEQKGTEQKGSEKKGGGVAERETKSSGGTATLASVRAAGVWRVAMEPEAPPMNFVEGGSRKGFDYEMAEAIARKIGASRTEVVEADYDELPDLLRKGQVDAVMGGYVADPGVAKVDWSNGYLDFGLCLIVKQGSAIREVKHLAGRKVGIYTDEAAQEWLEANVAGAEITQYEGTGWFRHLDAGDVEAIVYDYPFAVEEIKEFPRLKIVKLNLNAAAYSVGLPSGNADYLDAVNSAIASVTGAPGFDSIVKRYFKSEQVQVQALPQGSKTYTVKPGDTLSGIAQAQLGDMKAWPRIWDLNKSRLANPHLIEVGFQLLMP
ncbi:MAG: transporter substrate-binding domain-containing protein [Candidatus Eisenbacteria bacterium]|nr:transporter substrate-binding domain-containing protein [Candidatus Eisenbacteria bacterium]